jgi:ribosomal protein L18E
MLFTTKKTKTKLEVEIDSVLETMSVWAPGSEEYTKMAENLERLYKSKALVKDEKIRFITPDTIAVIVGNLLGIAMILHHERLEVVTTKALGFVIKGRV